MSKRMTRLVEEEDTVYAVDLSCMQKKQKRKNSRKAYAVKKPQKRSL